MFAIIPLFAFDFGDVMRALVPIIFLVIWVLSQLAGDKKNVPQARRRGGQPAQPPNPRLEDEIEDFLRQAADKRAKGGQPADAQPARPRQPPERPKPEPIRRAPMRPLADEVVQAEVVQPPRREQPAQRLAPLGELDRGVVQGESVAEHVEHHLDADKFADKFQERTSHLGERVGHADEDMEARLHRKFDHQVGKLKQSSGGLGALTQTVDSGDDAYEREVVASEASEIAEMLRNPSTFRKAMILQEILRRPADDL